MGSGIVKFICLFAVLMAAEYGMRAYNKSLEPVENISEANPQHAPFTDGMEDTGAAIYQEENLIPEVKPKEVKFLYCIG